ncbi:hypothetical protein KBD75_04505 [Candidatus Woesebacteria bacterium]|nr:hypothetical protein [Candidatus Woesebacteria bacterium]
MSLAIEACEGKPEFNSYVQLVQAGYLPDLIAFLNRNRNTSVPGLSKQYSELISSIQLGNACELVESPLLPILNDSVSVIWGRVG